MIKDLTSLKWRKNIYYISDNVIFDIESRKKKFDIDCCDTYLIDVTSYPKTVDGGVIDPTPETYINNVPYILAEFIAESERTIQRYFPVQYLIEEGDKVIDGKVVQTHPNVFDNKYINKFNQEIFNYIKSLLKNKETFDLKNVKLVINSLPDWLTVNDDRYMTENYIDKYFLKGSHYNQKLATVGDSLFKIKSIKLGIGDELYPINIWTEDVILEIVKAIYAEKFVNKYGNAFKYLTTSTMEELANNIKDVKTSEVPKTISTLLNVNYDGEDCNINFESLCVDSNVDTYYEYKNSISKYYSLIKDEASYNNNTTLAQYYEWSDRVNAPYKEDLWNTVENRAANVNDARKENEEFVLDENGNYIYDNCERCWKGAINAPGAKFPWMVIDYTGETPATITFKYTYPDGTVKEVKPWGEKIFGGNPNESRKTWGIASLAGEFEDNDFLLSENRNDGGQSIFDINRFEMILNYTE